MTSAFILRTIAHISDLHFGTEIPVVVAGLLTDLRARAPDLIVISGDLTQRARAWQFRAARRFLDELPAPYLVVPGNHDIPLYNVLARFFWPLAGYRRHITADLEPFHLDDELAVAGVNTARSNTWKDGRISADQIAGLCSRFSSAGDERFKILVAHHPFIPPHGDPRAVLVGGAKAALPQLEACGCGLILAGHLHLAYSGDLRPLHVELKRSMLVAQAGTAVSHRHSGETNAYNQILVRGNHLELEIRAWDGNQFQTRGKQDFERGESGWMLVGAGRHG